MSQKLDGSANSAPSSDGKAARRLTLLEKALAVLGAAFALATATLSYLTVQTHQDANQAQRSADSAGVNLTSLQKAYGQLESQNAQLRNQLSSLQSPSSTSMLSTGPQSVSYTIDINAPYAVPLGIKKPVQSDFNTSGIGDLGTATPGGHLVFVPINGNKMIGLQGGNAPTYQACTGSSVFATQADSKAGTSFCLLETGKVAGVTVTSLQPSFAELSVTVWQNGSQ